MRKIAMKKILWCAALLLAACSASTADLTPLDWQKVSGPAAGGALLGVGSPNSFDERGNFTVRAFKDGDVYKLYYGGSDTFGPCAGINSSHWRIGLAQSTDGINFTRVPGTATGGAVLDDGPAEHFDSYLTYRPFVLKDGATYRMWYNGSRKPFNCNAATGKPGVLADDRRIGYAESSDGVHWTRFYDGPGDDGSVLPLGAPGAIDAQQVGYVWVIQDNGQYKMYYSANDSANFWRVAMAVSPGPGSAAGGEFPDSSSETLGCSRARLLVWR